MLDREDKNVLRKILTVVTSPIWVPISAGAGLFSGPVRGFVSACKEADDAPGDNFDKAGKFFSTLPGCVLGKTITGPIEGIAVAGGVMWDNDD